MNLTEMVLDHPLKRSLFDYFLRVCEILRHCEDNAYVSSLTSGYLIWRSTL